MSSSGPTPFPLGAYVGQPDDASPSGQAAFEMDLSSFEQAMGAPPAYLDTFVNASDPISHWAAQDQWQSSSWSATPDLTNADPVIGLPLCSTQDGADADFKAFASGQYDSMLTQMVQDWAKAGCTTQYWRVGWEMNLDGNPSNAGSEGSSEQQDWVTAFQHVSTVLHAAAARTGVTANIVWNPGVTSYSSAGNAVANLYPGSQYVDVIGADVYADAYPYSLLDFSSRQTDASFSQWAADSSNLTHYYNYPAATQYGSDSSGGHATSLQDLIQLAASTGKPLGIAETGSGNSNGGHDVADNPTFVHWLASTLTTAQQEGVKVSFVNVWDSNGGGNYRFTDAGDDKPMEAAAWNSSFGATPLETDAAAPCFCPGTLILTGEGAVAVEDLATGGEVVTASGNLRPIVWIGHRTVDRPAFEQCPVRIRAGAFGGDCPERDLFLSPGHPVLVGADEAYYGGHLVPIMCLINGTTIERVSIDSVTYWHVELDEHDILLAEGLPAESYLDLGSRPWFGDAEGALLHPDLTLPGMLGRCRPVAVDGPVIDAERGRLNEVLATSLWKQCGWPTNEAGEFFEDGTKLRWRDSAFG